MSEWYEYIMHVEMNVTHLYLRERAMEALSSLVQTKRGAGGVATAAGDRPGESGVVLAGDQTCMCSGSTSCSTPREALRMNSL